MKKEEDVVALHLPIGGGGGGGGVGAGAETRTQYLPAQVVWVVGTFNLLIIIVLICQNYLFLVI